MPDQVFDGGSTLGTSAVLKSPGITVRPIQTIRGDSEFAEEFFVDVRVPQENTLGALNGLLESIDPYASYLNANHYKEYLKNFDTYKGDLGMVLAKKFGYITVISTVPGSPAAQAGLTTGDMLESIKMELEGNELLLADFPEVVFPIQRLDGIANRCNGQLYNGERTHIGWTAKEIVLPTMRPKGWIEDPQLQPLVRDSGLSLASGAVIKVAGIRQDD